MLLDQEQKQKAPKQTAQQARQESAAQPAILANMKAQYGSAPPPMDEMAAKMRAEKAPLAKQRLLNHMQSAYGNEYAKRVDNLVMAPKHEEQPEQPEEKLQELSAEAEEPELKAAETKARKAEAEPDKTPPAPEPAESSAERQTEVSAATKPEPALAPEPARETEVEPEEEKAQEPGHAQAPETAGKPGDENDGDSRKTQPSPGETESSLDETEPSPGEPESSPDNKKKAAAAAIKEEMTTKGPLEPKQLDALLSDIRERFGLSAARLEEKDGQPKIALYASPALFLPVAVFGALSAQKFGAHAANRNSVKAGDYLKSYGHDGPFHTPAWEVKDNFNTRFQGKAYGHGWAGGGNKKQKVVHRVPALNFAGIPLKSTNNNFYNRAGQVKAKSSVVRGTGRSGDGETLFGHFGVDEEHIKTGNTNTNYNGGHLVGDQIMDSHHAFDLYEDWNLAPQVRGFNSPVYTGTIENPVTKAIRNGATVAYQVEVRYPDNQYQIQPSVLAANLWPANPPYRQKITAAIALNGALDNPFHFRRRTPGYWSATAEVIAGGQTISSGNVRRRVNIAYENNPRLLRADRNYNPGGQEEVRYGVATYTPGVAGGKRQFQQGPNPKKYKYQGATKVTVVARQQTF